MTQKRRPGIVNAARLAQSNRFLRPGVHRYWRVFVTQTQSSGVGTDNDVSIAEVQFKRFFETPDISAGQVYIASTEDGANVASQAFDDNFATTWKATSERNEWVGVDFGVDSNDWPELQEVTFVQELNEASRAPVRGYVEYSDDTITWRIAWIFDFTEDPAWGGAQEERISQAPYGAIARFTTVWNDVSPRLIPISAWGTLLRNRNYIGPALQVENNANPGETQDIFFGLNGLIQEAPPYGGNTRVVRLYDQFGSSDLVGNLADNIQVRESDFTYHTWLLDFNGNGGLASVDTTSTPAPWALPSMLWVNGHIRETNDSLRPIWAIPANTNFMKAGVWQEFNDLHWRINSSNPADWAGTDWDGNQPESRDFASAIGDMTSGSPGRAYFNGNAAGTLAYSAPITYDASRTLGVGDGIITAPMIGKFSELTIFDHSAPAEASDIAALHAAVEEAKWFATEPEIEATNQRKHVILGGSPEDYTDAKTYQAHVILGGSPDDYIDAKTQQAHVILGSVPEDNLAVSNHQLHVIVQP